MIKYLIFALLFISCTSSDILDYNKIEATMYVQNNSGSTLDSLYIVPFTENPSNFVTLLNSETATIKIDMTDIPKMDGSYILSYHRENVLEADTFGYYTNGSPLEESIALEIKADTIIFTSVLIDYSGY